MVTLITDPAVEDRLKSERAARGMDRYDEVWEGVYMMPPMPNDQHQKIASGLTRILEEVVGDPGFGAIRSGINLSDRVQGWEQNYRVPDVAVFLKRGKAENHETYWIGAADFLVEIVSPGDHTREKLPFYGQLGVRELLIVECQPWRLELHRRRGVELQEHERVTLETQKPLVSDAVGLSSQLIAADPRP